MPKVGGKKFPYTKKGKAAAKKYKNTGRKTMATKKGKAAGKKTAMKATGRKKY
mgnify:CR=1 FL=1